MFDRTFIKESIMRTGIKYSGSTNGDYKEILHLLFIHNSFLVILNSSLSVAIADSD